MNFEAMKRFWDDRYGRMEPGWAHRMLAQVPAVETELRKHLDPAQPFGTLVDIGCGDGRFLPFLALVAKHVWGVDVSPVALQRATGKARNVTLMQADWPYNLPFRGGSVGAATVLFAFQHMVDDTVAGATAAELRRILAPGAKVVVVDNALDKAAHVKPRPADWFVKSLGLKEAAQCRVAVDGRKDGHWLIAGHT